MKIPFLIPCFCFLLAQVPVAVPQCYGLSLNEPSQIIVNNRILANVNGKAISVVDLMKKMDLIYYREFPQYAYSPAARFQFYETNWQHVLNELIDKELIVADAEEAKVPMSAGDVRQEMERLFGPNIIGNLDNIGMTFDEAQKIVHGDLLIQRMLFVRVNAKAMRNVTPKDVRNYYETYAKENVHPPEWTYQVITIRNKDKTAGAETANLAYHYVVNENVPLSELADKIQQNTSVGKGSQLSISEEYKHHENEISEAFKESLKQLSPENYSQPVSQTSRSDKSTVFRVFYLKGYVPEGAPTYAEVEGKLKDTLLEKNIIAESKAYLAKLRRHFDVQELMPEGFQPFELK